MIDFGLPVLFALFIWWFSTGAVLYMIGRPSGTFPAMMTLASGVSLLAIYALYETADDTTTTAAYIGFSSALLLWGWHETSFLTGLVTGPRTTPLPENSKGSTRLMPSIETVIYHELALFLTLALIAALTYGSPNEVGLWTFAILWAMRLSAKFNLYLGVPNLAEQFLPDHLKYLQTYFRRRSMNWLFPVSVTASTTTLIILIFSAASADTPFGTTGMTLLAALTALGLLEHWFLVLPLPADALFSWGLKSRAAAAEAAGKSDKAVAVPVPAA